MPTRSIDLAFESVDWDRIVKKVINSQGVAGFILFLDEDKRNKAEGFLKWVGSNIPAIPGFVFGKVNMHGLVVKSLFAVKSSELLNRDTEIYCSLYKNVMLRKSSELAGIGPSRITSEIMLFQVREGSDLKVGSENRQFSGKLGTLLGIIVIADGNILSAQYIREFYAQWQKYHEFIRTVSKKQKSKEFQAVLDEYTAMSLKDMSKSSKR